MNGNSQSEYLKRNSMGRLNVFESLMLKMFKVKVENLKQLDIVLLAKNVSEIILSRDSFAETDLPKFVNKIKKSNKLAWVLMERISRYEENMKPASLRLSTDIIFEIKNLDGIIIQNLDSFAYMLRKINKAANSNLKVELNYTMNCYNDETKKVYQKLYNVKRENAKINPLLFTAPVELNTYELEEVGYDTMILYSYIDTMVSANCLRKNTSVVNKNIAEVGTIHHQVVGADTIRPHRRGELCEPTCKYRFSFNNVQDFSSYIIDRKGKKLYYKTYCKYCYNKIFNTDPLFLLDKIEEISNLKIVDVNTNDHTFRIDFSFENEKEVKDILSMKCPESFTRGHYKNSIK